MSDLVWIDADYDREYAGGRSRYGAYLRQNALMFEDVLDDPASFTAEAWRVATGPVMSPGYAQWRADLWQVTCRLAQESSDLVVDFEIRLRWRDLSCRDRIATARLGDWERAQPWGGGPDRLIEPYEHNALLLTARHWLILDVGLLHDPAESRRAEQVQPEDAKRAVATLVGLINERARDIVSALRGES